MYIKNCWYTVAWNYELEDEGLFKTSVLNEPMVIYRSADGGYAALEDRCCHRGAPLSKARREGDDLRCMYHGLKFNPSGRCVEIPGQPKIPDNTCVRSYPVVEKHSWIWVWMGDPAKADVALIPRAMALDTPGFKSRSGFIEYDTDYQEVNDNLLDFSHLAYVHPTSFGASEDWAYTRPKIERLDRGLRVSRYVRNQDPAFGDKDTGKLDLWSSYDYQVPGVMLLHSHALLAGSADINNDGLPTSRKRQASSPNTVAKPSRHWQMGAAATPFQSSCRTSLTMSGWMSSGKVHAKHSMRTARLSRRSTKSNSELRTAR
ncbi:Rieske 2Fe-2S domain-containing protein [Pseudomonas proteolytica]|nr:Rieske 2Fe-2S domain-containing protein [Pseudomonas proteolytica]